MLRLPYFWDEAGYYIPAAWDLFTTGRLIPRSTLTNAHPPVPSLLLAACWKLFGYTPAVTRSLVCLVAAGALAAVHRLAQILTQSTGQAAAIVLLTAIYPVWFAQSTLAHADIFAAAATLWALVFFWQNRSVDIWIAAACFTVAALAKETSIAIPLVLAAWTLIVEHRKLRAALLGAPVLPLALWFLYHRHVTGFFFGNPEFLRYNAAATLEPLRMLVALGNRTLQLFAHMNMFALTLPAASCLLLPRLAGRATLSRADRARLRLLVGTGLVFFSLLGGALLTRYLLPFYPLVVLLAVNTLATRVRRWPWLAGFAASGFLLALFVNPPYQFAPEDNLDYSRVVRLHRAAIAELEERYDTGTILTAWPVADELTRPELGYVAQPRSVVTIDNFSLPQIEKAASGSESYTTALLFSTKYTPAHVLVPLGPWYREMDRRYFAAHTDLQPEEIARLLGGTVIWQRAEGGQWAAILHFDRPQLALGR